MITTVIEAPGVRAERGPTKEVKGTITINHGPQFRQEIVVRYINRKVHENADGAYYVYKITIVGSNTVGVKVENVRIVEEGGAIAFELVGPGRDITAEIETSVMAGFRPKTAEPGIPVDPVGGELWKYNVIVEATTEAVTPDWPDVRTLWDTHPYNYVEPNESLNVVVQKAVFSMRDLLAGGNTRVKFLDASNHHPTPVTFEIEKLNDGSGIQIKNIQGMRSNRGYLLEVGFPGQIAPVYFNLSTKSIHDIIGPNDAISDC